MFAGAGAGARQNSACRKRRQARTQTGPDPFGGAGRGRPYHRTCAENWHVREALLRIRSSGPNLGGAYIVIHLSESPSANTSIPARDVLARGGRDTVTEEQKHWRRHWCFDLGCYAEGVLPIRQAFLAPKVAFLSAGTSRPWPKGGRYCTRTATTGAKVHVRLVSTPC